MAIALRSFGLVWTHFIVNKYDYLLCPNVPTILHSDSASLWTAFLVLHHFGSFFIIFWLLQTRFTIVLRLSSVAES